MVSFARPYSAAIAYENCITNFNPQYQHQLSETDLQSFQFSRLLKESKKGIKRKFTEDSSGYPTKQEVQSLIIQGTIELGQKGLKCLCDLVPGLKSICIDDITGRAFCTCDTPEATAYAFRKLNGFEICAQKLSVVFSQNKSDVIPSLRGLNREAKLKFNSPSIKSECLGPASNDYSQVSYCSLQLPLKQPIICGKLAHLLYIVCIPERIQEYMLQDAFCRFGQLIDVYLIYGKNYGYAKFGKKENADLAKQTLNCQIIGGSKLYIVDAEHKDGEPMGKRGRF